tara:strand:- start:554 stop:2092 length:1539 start_codon:yes stop_codon:yes gene_type:complete
MLSVVSSAALQGIDATLVQVEVNTGEKGELKIVVVGLPDAAVKESQDRVFSAVSNSGFMMPRSRTTINLAPGNVRKEGPMYDLPMALGILLATDQIAQLIKGTYLTAGELGLSGEIRAVRGGLSMARYAADNGFKGIILPAVSAKEASIVEGIDVISVKSLDEVTRFLEGKLQIEPMKSSLSGMQVTHNKSHAADFSEIKGQLAVRRAVEVAVAGGHNLLLIGPPGSGKSMLAKRIPSIMPQPTVDEFLEIISIHSAAGRTLKEDFDHFQRPFRAPHHTISDVGLLGGGSVPGPGEISLAHNGILFLDELPEYKRSVLEVMRQPLEDREVTISRSAGSVTLPAAFMLVAAMNPCPCGYLGDRQHECRCSPVQIQRYRSRISGPLLDRIDIHIEAPALKIDELRAKAEGEGSEPIRERIEQCRTVQQERSKGSLSYSNSSMTSRDIRDYCGLEKEQGDLLQTAMEELSLSARAYDRILKVSRTIADLAKSDLIETAHLLEAIQYRSLDRNIFY